MTPGDRSVARRGEPAPCIPGLEQLFLAVDHPTYRLFYEDFSNQVLWLVQHGLQWPPELTEPVRLDAWQRGYEPANRAFAQALVENIDETDADAVMFHDYHFYLAPRLVRHLRPETYLQHFIHIPWPGPGAWRALPADIVNAICEGLCSNDSVVFQTTEFARNFLLTCREYVPAADVDLEASLLTQNGSMTKVWSNAVSIDPVEIMAIQSLPEFRAQKDSIMSSGVERLIVRVDRLDPSKNILRGFEAYARLLDTNPSLRGRVQFLAYLVPSRTTIRIYREYGERVRSLVAQINERYGTAAWQPVRLVLQHNRVEALAGLAVADVVVVNSVADGMNLVAKEAALINERDAALVLSRTTGAYKELASASIGIDPFDLQETAASLRRALALSSGERRRRAHELRAAVLGHDLRSWFLALLADIDHGLGIRSSQEGSRNAYLPAPLP
jgi:trehalose 6-phosphate synthase